MTTGDLEKLVEAAVKTIREKAEKWEKAVFDGSWDDDTTVEELVEDFRDYLGDPE